MRYVVHYGYQVSEKGGIAMAAANDSQVFTSAKPGSDKVRLTLNVAPSVKDELKRQAKDLGVSPSAYIAVLVGERRNR